MTLRSEARSRPIDTHARNRPIILKDRCATTAACAVRCYAPSPLKLAIRSPSEEVAFDLTPPTLSKSTDLDLAVLTLRCAPSNGRRLQSFPVAQLHVARRL